MYLCRFRQNVCIMDFDLEAPGLHYKFPQLIKSADIKKGLVDYIYEFLHNKVVPKSLNKFSLRLISPSNSQGEIRLIPAGNALSPNYWRKLASIDWHSLFYEEGGEGIPFFLELKEGIKEEFDPDFLLIDSRTGITEMSGLCTSLLPDKVVFLIVNNQENIEGARQILQSIQKVERFPGQEPIRVIFALTRIPFPRENSDEETEMHILKNVQDFLNEPMEDLENQLDIQDICILHSDRGLEILESLRISQKEITKETPLSQDYLRLFSRIIPEKVILPQLDSIIEEITTTEKLLEDPNKVQQELEGLVRNYLHPKSLEKLINFYILRNAGREKILGTFHELWGTFGIDNPKILLKYISFFMTWELSSWKEPKFELEIVEKYLELNPKEKLKIERRLADAYRKYKRPRMALKHYHLLMDEVEEKTEILGEILDICIDKKYYRDALKFFEKYSHIIDSDISLQVKKVEVLFNANKVEEVETLLADRAIEDAFSEKKPILYVYLMEKLKKPEKIDEKLNEMFDKAIKTQSSERIREVGIAYYRIGRAEDFKSKITGKHPKADVILRYLDERFRK